MSNLFYCLFFILLGIVSIILSVFFLLKDVNDKNPNIVSIAHDMCFFLLGIECVVGGIYIAIKDVI